MNLAERLRILREAKGVAQKEVALYLHKSVGTVSNYEAGIHQPDLVSLRELADYYGVSIDYLVGREGATNPIDELREQVFFGCLELPESSLKTLLQIAQLMKHYEISVTPLQNS